MGYYTGSGVRSGGGSTVGVYEHFIWYGSHNVYQQHTETTTRKSGVSLDTAASDVSSISMTDYRFTWSSGNASAWYNSCNCKGTTKNVKYSQIGDSNLYEMTIEIDTVKAKLDNGNWVS